MTSVVSLRTVASSSSVPIVVFVDMQREYLAKALRLAISGIDRALDNCRRVLDHSRRVGLPVAFIRMVNESAFFNRATPFVRWIDGFEPHRDEMVFERSAPSCYSSKSFAALVNHMSADDVHRAVSRISGLYGEVYETTDWIASTLPRKLGYGKNAGG
jgi:hypothetical protein